MKKEKPEGKTKKPKKFKALEEEKIQDTEEKDNANSQNEEEEVEEIQETLVEGKKRSSSRHGKESFEKESWMPRTSLGMEVKKGTITDISEILDNGRNIRESEIVDALLPNLTVDLLMVGQSKGKFGGGQKRVFKQTQKKTQEGNKPKFATFAVVG